MSHSSGSRLAPGINQVFVPVSAPDGTALVSKIAPGAYLLKLSGSLVDEGVLRNVSIPADAKILTVNCKQVERMNSCGTRGWFRLFQALKTRGVEMHFVECAPAVVDRFNLFPGFSCGGTIESVYVPFLCTQCHIEWVGLVNSKAVLAMGREVPHQNCQKCGTALALDDRMDEYFSFLGP